MHLFSVPICVYMLMFVHVLVWALLFALLLAVNDMTHTHTHARKPPCPIVFQGHEWGLYEREFPPVKPIRPANILTSGINRMSFLNRFPILPIGEVISASKINTGIFILKYSNKKLLQNLLLLLKILFKLSFFLNIFLPSPKYQSKF